MKTYRKIPIVCLQFLLVLGLLFGTQTTVKADQLDEGKAAHNAGNNQEALKLIKPPGHLGIKYGLAGEPRGIKKRARWYHKAAEQGDVYAQYNLGQMYAKGKGVPQDYTEALKWFHKAAEQGLHGARYRLGQMYAKGKGVPQDYTEAAKWFHKVAERGDPLAQSHLGILYAKGKGVPQDYVQAHKWFSLAASRWFRGERHKEAVHNRNVIKKRMTPAQVAEAHKLAHE